MSKQLLASVPGTRLDNLGLRVVLKSSWFWSLKSLAPHFNVGCIKESMRYMSTWNRKLTFWDQLCITLWQSYFHTVIAVSTRYNINQSFWSRWENSNFSYPHQRTLSFDSLTDHFSRYHWTSVWWDWKQGKEKLLCIIINSDIINK